MPTNKGRIAVVLEPDIYEWIKTKASDEGRTASNLAAFLLTRAVKEQMQQEVGSSKDDVA